jgi:ppGpp synthetase/RelA/SpoT-type nucleotidyltranferase
MEFSQHDIRKLGKRLRDGSRDPIDINFLEKFRESHDSLLLEYSLKVCSILDGKNIKFLATGRPKRTKSIIRKLERPENVGMDLFRLGDLVGLRIIVADIQDQNICDEMLVAGMPVIRRNDYRDRQDGYRAIHYVLNDGKSRLEIQLRTLTQHLWAEESESFGEKVKEGGGPDNIRGYLNDLASICYKIENEVDVDGSINTSSEIFSVRNPTTIRLERLIERFCSATGTYCSQSSSYLMVFDSGSKELTRFFLYGDSERHEALDEFRRLSKQLAEDRYDVLVFNTSNQDAVMVTHSRFF